MSKLLNKFEEDSMDLLRNLEARIDRIESVLNLDPQLLNNTSTKEEVPSSSGLAMESDKLEFQIGQFWFAKAGFIVLALGIIFLLSLPYESLHPIVPSMLGYVIMISIFAGAHLTRNSFEYISKYLFGSGLLLLYFSTMRLHYFSAAPVVESDAVIVFLLSLAVLVHAIIGRRNESPYITGIAVTLFYITAVISDNSYVIFTFLTISAMYVVYLKLTKGWNKLLIYSVALTFMLHLNWFINNPLIGNKIQLLDSPDANLYFLLIYIIIFSLSNILDKVKTDESDFTKWSSFAIAFGGFIVFILISILKFRSELVILHVFSFATFLSLAIAFRVKGENQYSTFFYSILGYTSLSVAIIAQFPLPEFFVWLCWQSLIVIITAIWFRSKIVIVANFIIYLGLFFVYLFLAEEMGAFTLSYGIIALVSARILNWRKEQLNLKTELMRNAYLAVAFFVFPYTMYKLMPEGYVAISWIGIAALYYLLSRILANNKYRWMALLTIMLTVGYLLLIGTTQLDPILRIVSFILLGLTLLTISIIYSKRKSQQN